MLSSKGNGEISLLLLTTEVKFISTARKAAAFLSFISSLLIIFFIISIRIIQNIVHHLFNYIFLPTFFLLRLLLDELCEVIQLNFNIDLGTSTGFVFPILFLLFFLFISFFFFFLVFISFSFLFFNSFFFFFFLLIYIYIYIL